MTTTINNATTLAASLALAFALAACAPLVKRAPAPGTPLAEVTAQLGKPTAVYPGVNGGQVLEYRGQPMGQFQYMARIGADGRLLSYDQVLTSENFAKVPVARWKKDDILHTFGEPAEKSHDRATDSDVWSYRYKQDGISNSMMDIYFNGLGTVRKLDNSPDPVLDDRFKGM